MSKKQYGMVVDLRRCAGCHACTVSCKSEHDVPLGSFRTRVDIHEEGKYPKVTRHFIPMLCNQCTDAPCIPSCPTEAIYRDDNGIVHIDQDTCVGANACVSACPYEAIYIDQQTGIADKCDFCSDRLIEGKDPSCVSSCPTDAFLFGDLNDPSSTVSHFIREQKVKRVKEEKGANPNVYYYQLEEKIEKRLGGINHVHSKRKEW
jgi:tetrathionate reductase subunit B